MTDISALCDACEKPIGIHDEHVQIDGHLGQPYSRWHLCMDCSEDLRDELAGESRSVLKSVIAWIRENRDGDGDD
jgi:hypothetical protein